MKIYTKTGDRGETGLPGGRRLTKTAQLFETLGALDQTSAAIGVSRSLTDLPNIVTLLDKIQSDLFLIGSLLASPTDLPEADQLTGRIRALEGQIDRWDQALPKLRNFVLPGGDPGGAMLHLARTQARQAERHYHRLDRKSQHPRIAEYLNRLSDFLFQAARFVNYSKNSPEEVWKSPF